MNQDVITYATADLTMLVVDAGLFPSLCTIKVPPPNALSPTGGQPPISAYTAQPGLIAIPCIDSPESTTLSVNELLSVGQVTSRATRKVLLDRYYPELSPVTNWGDIGWIAEIDSTAIGGGIATYRLLGAERDTQATQTRLRLERVTV